MKNRIRVLIGYDQGSNDTHLYLAHAFIKDISKFNKAYPLLGAWHVTMYDHNNPHNARYCEIGMSDHDYVILKLTLPQLCVYNEHSYGMPLQEFIRHLKQYTGETT